MLIFSQIQLSFMLSPCLFLSQIQLSHAQSMLIFSKNLAQPCLFLTCFETKPEKMPFWREFCLFQGNSSLAMLIFLSNLAQPCLDHAYIFFKSSLAMLSPCLFFLKSSLAMLISFMLIKKSMYSQVKVKIQLNFPLKRQAKDLEWDI